MKLFCLTYAGGNASFYNQLESLLSPAIQVIKLEYSGHGNRHKERFYNSFEELSEDMYSLIKSQVTPSEQYAIMGYSMGSISAMEVLRRVIREGQMHLPLRLFLAAHEPHTKAELANYGDGELDELVKERTIRFGAIPESLLDNKIFWRMYLPIYRADYGIIGKYKFEDCDFNTDVPATVFYSETDTPLAEMKKWADIFTAECEFIPYDGTHFFIQQHTEEIAMEITDRLVKANKSEEMKK